MIAPVTASGSDFSLLVFSLKRIFIFAHLRVRLKSEDFSQLTRHRILLALLFAMAVLVSFGNSIKAQGPIVTEDESKVNIYKRFTDNRVPNPPTAYAAAKEYMQRYPKDSDQYTNYFKQWIEEYEFEERECKLLQDIYRDKAFAPAYELGKTVLAEDPENLKVLLALGYGGYLATSGSKNESLNAEAIRYANKAIQLIEAGHAPTIEMGGVGGGVGNGCPVQTESDRGSEWKPFKNKDDALASLHYAIGYTEWRTQPDEAINQFVRVIQLESDLKRTPLTYELLGVAYTQGPYKRLSADYTKRFANQPESPEGKAALDALNKVADKIIDAYARAVALAGNDPKLQASKADSMRRLTDLYKFRHDNSDAGLNELIAGVLARPLPQP